MDEAPPKRRRNWFATAVVFFLWGTNGLEQGKSLPRVSLSAVLLIITFAGIWLAQHRIEEFEESARLDWIEALRRGPPVPSEFPSHRTSALVAAFNLVALVVGCILYKRHRQLALWIGVVLAVAGTALAIAINALLQ